MHKGKAKLSGVLHKGFKPDKCKTALRMAVARIKLLRNRKEAQVRQMRRELAQLLESDQDQTARIRVEHVIREEKMMAAYDLIEVYCELIVARLPIIESQKNCPIDLKEAIASVIFASMRCSDVTELMDVRKHFSAKYGKEFAAAALEVRPDSGVNRLVIEKLSAGAPDVQSKTKTLSSIAEEHNIKWEPKAFEEKLQKQNDLLYGSATYAGANIPTMGSSTYSMSMPQPTYSGTSTTTVESSTSHMPPAPASYSSAEIAGNRVAYNPANSNAFSLERGPSASIPPNSQYGATTYSAAENLGNEAAHNPANSNNSSHGNAGGSGLSRPHSQYVGPVSVSREEEVSQPRERKPSVSGSNWNMEFKDATSAAQAAAESAEMASLAARAAAQLASRGSFSAEKNTETYESPTYIHENTPRRQPVEHFMKDERKSFDEQRPGINDPRVINHAGSQYMSSTPSPLQSHSSGPTIHAGVYSMPTAQPPSHSSGSPIYDNLYEREDIIGKTAVHRFDLPEERLSDSGLGGHNIKDMESRQASFDQKNTNNYYSNFDSYHYPFSHDKTTIWGDHKDKSTGDSSGVVFDQYDSDGEERSTFRTHNKENLLDNFSSKHTEEYKHFEEQNRFSPNADRSEWLRSGSLVNDNTSTLFSRKEEQPSDNIGASSKDSRSPHSYDNVPPAFDSDGASSDEEEITTTRTAEKIRPHSSPSIGSSGVSGFTDEKKETEGANRIAEKLIPDIDESTEEYESMSTKKYQNNSTFDLYKKSARSGESPKSVYSVVQGNVSHVQTSDSDLSEEETEHKLKGSSLDLTGAKENQSSSFSMQTSATSNEKYEGDLGLKFGKLTPGLRNKLRQPPYTKYSEDNVLQEQTLRKTPASITESVHSYENDTSPDQTANSPSSSRTTKTSFGASSSEELYDKMQVGARREDRSRMTRNYFGLDDAEKLSERTDSTPTSARTSKSSFGANSSQELYDDKPGVGAGREARSRVTRSYFDSDDSEEELERQQTVQTKWSREQKQSRRTREGTSDTKRDGVSQTGTESMPKEAKFPSESLCNAPTEEIAEAPMYSRVPVRRPSQMPVQSKHSLDRGKSQEADLTENSVSENDGNPSTEALAGTPKESAPKAASHVHPKLPDYDSFAAHFQSLRVNRR